MCICFCTGCLFFLESTQPLTQLTLHFTHHCNVFLDTAEVHWCDIIHEPRHPKPGQKYLPCSMFVEPFMILSVVDRLMPPPHQVVHVLILRTYEYFTLYGTKFSEDIIKMKDLEMWRLSWITQMGQSNHRNL